MTQVKITTGVFGSPIQTSYTLDDLEKDDEFQETAERFLESIGEKSNDVFEYLRDSDFNLVSGMQRAMQSGKFNEQQKQDYSYLRSKFDNADMGSLRQYLELIKDASVDIVTDPTLITAALTAPITGGTSFAARQGVATAGLKTAKAVASNKLKDVGQKQIAKATAITGAEIGAWTGLDNHFRQNTELNVGLRQMYSKPELVGSTALGTLTGGLFGNLAQRNALFNSRMNRLYSNDEYRADAGNELLFKARKAKDAIKAVTIGKPTSILKTIAEYSPTARKLGQTFTEDFERRLTERTTKRLGYSYAEDLDSRRSKYLFLFDIALKPIRKTGKVTSDDEIGVIRILRGDDASAYRPEVQEAATNLRKMYDTILKDAEDVGLEPHRIENYFSRSWNKKAILNNEPEFKKMLVEDGVVPADEVNDVVRGMLNKNNELYSSHSNLLGQARSFKNLNDNKYEKFLTNDLIPVATNYFMNAARAIEHKKTFLLPTKAEKLAGKTDETVLKGFQQSNEDQFVERYITKIDNELAAARNGKGLSRRDKQKIVKLYKSVTGQVDYFDSGLIQGIYDTTKLANAVAYLPLATISSFTEAFIPLAKAPTKSYVKGVYDGITKGHKIFTDETVNVIKQKHGLSDDAIRREMASVWIGIDEAMADVTNRLAGEGLQNEILQKGARGFYRFNLLVPWTKTVQLAAFSTGKDLIQSNLNKLNKLSKEGVEVMSDFAPVKAQNLKSELFDLGVDVDQGLKWLNAGAKLDDEFYEQIVRGAGRFTNEVILQTSRERAKVPLYMTNPKFDILTQFLRYPTVFSNTILKNFARNTITNPAVNAPRLTAFAIMATNVALATNYWRSSKEERDRINEEGLDNKDILRAFQRIGLLGPLEHGYRYSESLSYGQNPLVGLINLGGPAINDIVGMTLYDRGLLETAARKAPLIGTRNVLKNYTGLDPYTPLKEKAKEKDDEINAFIEDIARKISMNAEEESGRTKSQLEPMTRSTLNTGGFVTATGNFQSTSETEQEIDKITGDAIFNFFKEREKRRDKAHQEIIKASKEGDVRKGFEAFETLPIGEQLAGYMNPVTNVPLSATGAGVYTEKAQPSFKSPKEFILDAINPRKNILQKMPIKVEDPLSAGIAVAEATGLIPVAGFAGKGISKGLRKIQARRGDDTMGGGGGGSFIDDSVPVDMAGYKSSIEVFAEKNVNNYKSGQAFLDALKSSKRQQDKFKKEELEFIDLDNIQVTKNTTPEEVLNYVRENRPKLYRVVRSEDNPTIRTSNVDMNTSVEEFLEIDRPMTSELENDYVNMELDRNIQLREEGEGVYKNLSDEQLEELAYKNTENLNVEYLTGEIDGTPIALFGNQRGYEATVGIGDNRIFLTDDLVSRDEALIRLNIYARNQGLLEPVSTINPDVPLKTQVPESVLKGEDTLSTSYGNDYEKYRLPMGGATNYREITIHLDNPKTPTVFTDNHLEGADQILHYRISDRVDTEGNKVLFVEEIQSDLHQAARTRRYISEDGSVPDYPYKSLGFVDIAMKDVMQLAAKEGYDKVAFTDAATQINRNKKSLNYIDSIRISKTPTKKEILESEEFRDMFIKELQGKYTNFRNYGDPDILKGQGLKGNEVYEKARNSIDDYKKLRIGTSKNGEFSSISIEDEIKEFTLERLLFRRGSDKGKWVIEEIGLPNTQVFQKDIGKPLMYESKDNLKDFINEEMGKTLSTRVVKTDEDLLKEIPESMKESVKQDIKNNKEITIDVGKFKGSGKKFLDLYKNKITSTAKQLGKEYKVEPKFSTIVYTKEATDTSQDVLKRWKDAERVRAGELEYDDFEKIHGEDEVFLPRRLKVISLDVTPDMKEPMAVFAKGGLVEGKDDVPYTKENPADRVDPFTGQPYSAQMEELGLDVFQER